MRLLQLLVSKMLLTISRMGPLPPNQTPRASMRQPGRSLAISQTSAKQCPLVPLPLQEPGA